MSQKFEILAEAVDSSQTALRNADIVCTETTSSVPVFEAGDMASGTPSSAIWSRHPTTREIPSDLTWRSCLFVESRAAVMEETEDLIIPIQEGLISRQELESRLIELDGLVSGKVIGRDSGE